MTAAYAGSFDPFTWGHFDILCKAAKMFDKIYIVLANNPDKTRMFPVHEMHDALIDFMRHDGPENCQVIVVIHDGLIAQFCANMEVDFLIRGLRNPLDYLAEENIAKINKFINPKLETIYLRAGEGCGDIISSSMVKQLYTMAKNGKVDEEQYRRFVPLTISECMEGKYVQN